MKKLFLIIGIVLVSSMAVDAQSCATGFCPPTITVHHVAGPVSPTTGDITYNVVKAAVFGSATGGYCMLDRNLGVTTLPTSESDYTNGTGWFFQWGKVKGWTAASISANLATYTQPASNATTWPASEDPCAVLLGSAWRVPTASEWTAWGSTNFTPTLAFSTLKFSLNTYYTPSGTAGSSNYVTLWGNSSTGSNGNAYSVYASSVTGTFAYSPFGGPNYSQPVRCIKNFAN